jgi:hypothetical protein
MSDQRGTAPAPGGPILITDPMKGALEQYVLEATDALRTRDQEAKLYHYTNQSGLIGIITNRETWATHIRYLNDSAEFEYAVDLAATVLTEEHRPSTTIPSKLRRCTRCKLASNSPE